MKRKVTAGRERCKQFFLNLNYKNIIGRWGSILVSNILIPNVRVTVRLVRGDRQSRGHRGELGIEETVELGAGGLGVDAAVEVKKAVI